MSTLFHLVAYGVPWWIWGCLGLAGVFALARLFGSRAAFAAGAALALVLAHRRGAQQGYAHAQEKGDRDARRTLDAARTARADADRRDGDARRLHDDDGFRRD